MKNIIFFFVFNCIVSSLFAQNLKVERSEKSPLKIIQISPADYDTYWQVVKGYNVGALNSMIETDTVKARKMHKWGKRFIEKALPEDLKKNYQEEGASGHYASIGVEFIFNRKGKVVAVCITIAPNLRLYDKLSNPKKEMEKFYKNLMKGEVDPDYLNFKQNKEYAAFAISYNNFCEDKKLKLLD